MPRLWWTARYSGTLWRWSTGAQLKISAFLGLVPRIELSGASAPKRREGAAARKLGLRDKAEVSGQKVGAAGMGPLKLRVDHRLASAAFAQVFGLVQGGLALFIELGGDDVFTAPLPFGLVR